MYQLEIKNRNSLLSIILRKEITPAQVSIVTAISADPTITYGEVLAWLASRRETEETDSDHEARLVAEGDAIAERYYDFVEGAGESVEASRG